MYNCKSCHKSILEGYFEVSTQHIYCSADCACKDMTMQSFDKAFDNWDIYWKVFETPQLMEPHLFRFPDIFEFEEVYVIVDRTNSRIHLSIVDYSYTATFDIEGDLVGQLEKNTEVGNSEFNGHFKKIGVKIFKQLKLI